MVVLTVRKIYASHPSCATHVEHSSDIYLFFMNGRGNLRLAPGFAVTLTNIGFLDTLRQCHERARTTQVKELSSVTQDLQGVREAEVKVNLKSSN